MFVQMRVSIDLRAPLCASRRAIAEEPKDRLVCRPCEVKFIRAPSARNFLQETLAKKPGRRKRKTKSEFLT